MQSFDSYNDTVLLDMLFETNLSNREIAEQLGFTPAQVSQKIRSLGLGWIRRGRGFASRGQASLTAMVKRLVPGVEIISEYAIGERLKLDIYCPKYQLAVEYHGRQHFEYIEFFHHDSHGFDDHYKRDLRKAEICQEKGIALVVFRYNDLLTEDMVFERLMEALASTKTVEAKPKTLKGNPVYEAHKQRQREYRKQAYVRMKRHRDGIREK